MTSPVIARDGKYAASLLGAGAANAGFKWLILTILLLCQFAYVAADKLIT
jgi:hypothetical protein